jgi:hypothetical protein
LSGRTRCSARPIAGVFDGLGVFPASFDAEAAVSLAVQNPTLSAEAFLAAAGAVWRSEPQTALEFLEDSLVLARAGASDQILGVAQMWAGVIRAQNGGLPGALAALQESVVQQRSGGSRLFLGIALWIAAAMLALLGEAQTAAALAGAVPAHFPASASALNQDERMGLDEAQSLARQALGEAAYSAALRRGATIDEYEVVTYPAGELRKVAAPFAEPGAQTPESSGATSYRE